MNWLANTRPHDVLAPSRHVRAAGTSAARVCFLMLGANFEASGNPEVCPLPTGGGAELFLALFLAVHACVLRVASAWLTGVGARGTLQANTSRVGCSRGVRRCSLCRWRHTPTTGGHSGRLSHAAAVMHSTYLLPAPPCWLHGQTDPGSGCSALAVRLFALASCCRRSQPAGVRPEDDTQLGRPGGCWPGAPHHGRPTGSAPSPTPRSGSRSACRAPATALFLPLAVPIAAAILSVEVRRATPWPCSSSSGSRPAHAGRCAVFWPRSRPSSADWRTARP